MAEGVVASAGAKYVGEFIGTYFLVLVVGCNVLTGSWGAALSIGAILTVMIYAIGPVSGAHLNPAVTVAILLSSICRGTANFVDAIVYILVQLLAGVAAGLTYVSLIGASFTVAPVGRYTTGTAVTLEALYTLALCYVVLSVATVKAKDPNHFFGLAIGFTVTAAALAIGGISGCALNPAVALGAAASSWWHELGFKAAFAYFPYYLFAHLIGALGGFVCFHLVQIEPEDPPKIAPPEPVHYARPAREIIREMPKMPQTMPPPRIIHSGLRLDFDTHDERGVLTYYAEYHPLGINTTKHAPIKVHSFQFNSYFETLGIQRGWTIVRVGDNDITNDHNFEHVDRLLMDSVSRSNLKPYPLRIDFKDATPARRIKTFKLERNPMGIEFSQRAPIKIAHFIPGSYAQSLGAQVGWEIVRIGDQNVEINHSYSQINVMLHDALRHLPTHTA